jgi:hypothetical protein
VGGAGAEAAEVSRMRDAVLTRPLPEWLALPPTEAAAAAAVEADQVAIRRMPVEPGAPAGVAVPGALRPPEGATTLR